MRVPRRVLGEQYGIWRGSLGMAHEMHCEDNKTGLWCTTTFPQTPRRVWRALGDAMLLSAKAKIHFKVTAEAVRRSFEEVVASYNGKTLAAADQALALVPVPLPPGERPEPGDVLPFDEELFTEGSYPGEAANHYPLYSVLADGKVAHRFGNPDVNVYIEKRLLASELFAVDFATQQKTDEVIPRLK
jgi:hypothetical protein